MEVNETDAIVVQNFKIHTIVLLLIIGLLTSCARESKDEYSNDFDLSGLWYSVLADSTYMEVYFSDSVYSVFYSEVLNIFRYKIDKNDSIQVLDNMFGNKFKIYGVNDSTIIIKSKSSVFKYSKIKNDPMSTSEWVSFINGSASVRERYRQYFLSRQFNLIVAP